MYVCTKNIKYSIIKKKEKHWNQENIALVWNDVPFLTHACTEKQWIKKNSANQV